MIIENMNTGQRFEISDGARFPEVIYRIVYPELEPEPTPEPVTVKDTAPQFETKATPKPKAKTTKAKKTAPKKKVAKKAKK